MNLRLFKNKKEIYGTTISEAETARNTSLVSDSLDFSPYVKPEVEFRICSEYYRTIGKVQNAVEGFVAEVLSRDWYYQGPEESVKQLEDWEESINLSRLLEYVIRDWLVCGNSIIGVSDWEPVQITSVVGIKRNQYGVPEHFVQLINGKEVLLRSEAFIHTKFIEFNREAWGLGMLHSLLTTFDYNSRRRSLPQLEIYRRKVQLLYRILERYGSPVTVWFFENVARSEFEKQVEELRALEAGDRRILSKKVEIATETIDSRGTLLNATVPDLNADVETGLQSSSNRMISQPSAMADARAAKEKDDVRGLYIAEKIRALMNTFVIPRLVSSKRAEFKWGKQDSFEFDFNQLLQAASAGFVSPDEARVILKSVGWKLDDPLFKRHFSSSKPLQNDK